MLAPENRELLHDLIRPPKGYELDVALGTTYSLDLTTLLTVPLAFTRYQYAESDFDDLDILAVFNAMRKNADRMALFCQAGQIHVPTRQEPIYQLLEEMVIQAQSHDEEGSFHPKTWTFRFTAPEAPVRYRFVCSSRNLAFDRSWDTVVTLDGELTDRQNAYARNHPLGDFIEALPSFAQHDLDDNLEERIDRIQYEIRRVEFEPPDPFESFEFYPFGIGQPNPWPFPDRDSNLVVVSPFLSESLLNQFEPADRHGTLVSRWEELESITPSTLDPWNDVYALDPAAEQAIDDVSPRGETEAGREHPNALEESEGAGSPPLRGLHAKLYHVDRGWDSSIYTGSTNATNTGFNQSVEFLVELRGKKSKCGTELFLEQSENKTTFTDLLTRFDPEDSEDPDPDEEALDNLENEFRRSIIATDPVAQVEESGEEGFDIQLLTRGDALDIPTGVTARVRPISIAEGFHSLSDGASELAVFPNVSMAGLTSFFAFEATATVGEADRTTSFVLNVPLEGAPPDRDKHTIRSIIRDEKRFIRFLAMLLGDAERGLGLGMSQGTWREWSGEDDTGGMNDLPLLETLLRVLYQNPKQLNQVQELLADLRAVGETDGVIPEAFDQVFESIWDVREAIEE